MQSISILRRLVLLSLFLAFSLARPCTLHAHCTDGDTATADLCHPTHYLCLHIPIRQESTNISLLDVPSLIDQVNSPPLSLQDKLEIINTTSRLFEQINPHRFIQLNFYNVDIVSELQTLAQLIQQPPLLNQTNLDFHSRMQAIVESANDFHTVYIIPPPIATTFATLLFTVRDYFSPEDLRTPAGTPQRRYTVSDMSLLVPFENPDFKVGVELLTWDGIPMDRFIRQLGRRSYGANTAARIARAIDLAANRILAIQPIPPNPTVRIGFRGLDGEPGEVTVPWFFARIDDQVLLELFTGQQVTRPTTRVEQGLLPAQRDEPSSPESLAAMELLRMVEGRRTRVPVRQQFQDLFSAEIIETDSGTIGRLILPSFLSLATGPLIAELSRVLRLLPQNGLVVDVRGNVGGFPDYAKAVTELYSDEDIIIEALPMAVRASNLNVEIQQETETNLTRMEKRFSREFRGAVITSNRFKEQFTGPVSDLFSIYRANPFPRPERVYFGPVITLCDGRTYSAGDVFVALQVDMRLSFVVGVSDNVGGGGASTIPYGDLARAYPKIFKPLPGGVQLSTAFARFFRGGRRSGVVVESLGVRPQLRYFSTFKDATENDCDLFEFLGEKLSSMRML